MAVKRPWRQNSRSEEFGERSGGRAALPVPNSPYIRTLWTESNGERKTQLWSQERFDLGGGAELPSLPPPHLPPPPQSLASSLIRQFCCCCCCCCCCVCVCVCVCVCMWSRGLVVYREAYIYVCKCRYSIILVVILLLLILLAVCKYVFACSVPSPQ